MDAMRAPGFCVGARVRVVGLLLGAAAVVVSSSVVGVGEAASQPADETTTTAVVAPTPDPSVTLETPPVTTPLTDGTPVVPGPPEPDPSPRIRVSLARLAIIGAQTALVEQQTTAAAARDVQARAQASVDRAEQVRTDAERRLGADRDRLGSTAVYAYMHTPGGDVVAALRGDSSAGDRERQLFAAAVDHHRRQVAVAEDELERAGTELDEARQAFDRARQAADDQDLVVASASSTVADAQRELRTATAGEGRPTTPTSWQLSLVGATVFTADELTQWYEATGRGSKASVPIAELVRLFVDHGTAEGIRGDMAFAQSVHETGWFANLDTITANNFAGIGHCDTCPSGFPFATADIGVLAQIQLLESYDDADPTYDRPRAAPNLNGPRGCCQTWTELGGVWATDPNYGPRILSIYAGMLEWLVAERSIPA